MDLKERAKNSIDVQAEKALNRYVSYGPAQLMLSLEKSEQATDFIANGYPNDLSNYPFINAESIATGKTPKEVADAIILKKSEWIAIATQIEEKRLKAKKDIDNAVDDVNVLDIRKNAIEELENI